MERAAAGLRFLLLTAAIAAAGLRASAAAPQTPAYRPPADQVTRYLLLLKKGPAWSAGTSTEAAQLQRAHLLHLSMLAADRRVLIAGSVPDDSDLRGVAIMAADTIDDARAREAGDPAVAAGRLVAEIQPLVIAGNWFAMGSMTSDQPVRQFAIALLAAPPGRTGAEGAATASAHLEALWRDRESGALVLAGSIGGGAWCGLRVYIGDDLAAAAALARREAAANPALTADVHPWLAADGVLSIVK